MAPALPASRLLALPAELRNYIYELAFSPPCDRANITELKEAQPPSSALKQVNRQIYNDCRLMYRAAYRQYWASTEFIINSPLGVQVSLVREPIMSLGKDDLQHVRSLVVDFCYAVKHRGILANFKLTLMDPRGVWKVEGTCADRPSRLAHWAMGEGEGGQIDKLHQFDTAAEAITACSGLHTPALSLQLSAILSVLRRVQDNKGLR